jgi:hypothetical protein
MLASPVVTTRLVCTPESPNERFPDVSNVDVSEIAIKLRLFGGRSEHKGRLEIFYNNTWGTVCEDDFRDQEAHIACQTLGFP